MTGAHYTRGGLVPGGHTSDQVARRAAAIEQAKKLLAERPMSVFDLSGRLRLSARTVYGYLSHLQELGEVYQMDALDDRGRKTWALDDDVQQAASDRVQAEHGRRAWVVPARQVGMPRDPLVAALFGPAQGAAA